jgi:hypothetical protein
MSRIKSATGTHVVSPEAAAKVAEAAKDVWFTREQVLAFLAAEPRGMTVYAGPLEPRVRKRAKAITASGRKKAAKTASRDKPAAAAR